MQRQRRKRSSRILSGWSILIGTLSGLVFTGLGIFLVLLLKLLPWDSADSYGIFSEKDKEILNDNRYLFIMVLLLYVITLVLFVSLLIIRLKASEYPVLFGASLGAVIIPVIVSLLLGIAYPEPFRTLHSIILSLDFYTAASETNSIPIDFNTLFQCFILLIPGIVAFSVFLFCYIKWKRTHDDEYKMPRKQNYYYI